MKFYVKAFIVSVVLYAALCQVYSANLNKPESVVYSHEKGFYLVSNIGDWGEGCDITVHNELIIKLDQNGYAGSLRQALPGARGLLLAGDNLFVVWTCKIYRMSIETGDVLDEYFPIEFMFDHLLNDISKDNEGYLYVTDTKKNKIFKFDYFDRSYETLALTDSIDRPNGILYDEANNRLIVVSYIGDAPIKAVDLDDYTVTTLMETGLDLLDGITRDEEGNFYVSSWGDGTKGGGAVYKIAPDFSGEPELVESGFSGPADIYYNEYDGKIAVPNVLDNTVDFIQIKDVPKAPELIDAGEGNKDSVGVRPVLKWHSTGADSYNLQLAESFTLIFTPEEFPDPIINIQGITDTSYAVGEDLKYGTEYLWRVQAVYGEEPGPWSAPADFRTMEPEGVADELPQGPVHIFPNPAAEDVYLSLPEGLSGRINLKIYNCLGQKEQESDHYATGSGQPIGLDISALTPGIHYLYLSAGGDVIVKRLFVR